MDSLTTQSIMSWVGLNAY